MKLNLTNKQSFIIQITTLVLWFVGVGGALLACAIPSASFSPDNFVETAGAFTIALTYVFSKHAPNKNEKEINNNGENTPAKV